MSPSEHARSRALTTAAAIATAVAIVAGGCELRDQAPPPSLRRRPRP